MLVLRPGLEDMVLFELSSLTIIQVESRAHSHDSRGLCLSRPTNTCGCLLPGWFATSRLLTARATPLGHVKLIQELML